MGGNIFENTGRLTNDQYRRLSTRILRDTDRYEIKSYYNKESHGDLDVVLDANSELARETYKAVVEKNSTFFLNEYGFSVIDFYYCSKNKSFCSVLADFEGTRVQVDFLIYEDPIFAANYFSFNDLGNLIGRVAHSQGLIFGHDGLHYVLRDGDRVIKKFVVCKDFYQSLEYLGFDANAHQRGFSNLEDIFEYVVNSTHFNSHFYDLEKRSHRARTRDRKRKTYQDFLEYIKSFEAKEILPKSSYLEKHLKAFPDFNREYNEAVYYDTVSKEVKKHLNTTLLANATGLSGKALGEFLAKIGYKDFVETVIAECVTNKLIK